MDGLNQQFPLGLTFDDILLLPGYTDFSRTEIDLSTYLTKTIKLKIPFISSPMDTVTEEKMAIALGRLGGIGIIHRNLTINGQAQQVKKVKKEKLLVGAAIGAGQGFEERVETLVKADVDVIVIDSAHGFSKSIIQALKFIKKTYSQMQVIAGNVATFEGAKALMEAGADALRVGMGPGSICSTRVISGMGVPQLTAILEASKAAKKAGIPIIADGGIRYSGDMVKALASGASALMMGSFFASCLEAPGKIIRLRQDQVPHRFLSIFKNRRKFFLFKEYRAMGSIAAMRKGAKIKLEEEFHGKDYRDRVLVAEGIEGLVPVKGTVRELADQAVGGMKSGMYYVGARNIEGLWKKAKFIRITQASLKEGHPHDVLIVNPGENYQ